MVVLSSSESLFYSHLSPFLFLFSLSLVRFSICIIECIFIRILLRSCYYLYHHLAWNSQSISHCHLTNFTLLLYYCLLFVEFVLAMLGDVSVAVGITAIVAWSICCLIYLPFHSQMVVYVVWYLITILGYYRNHAISLPTMQTIFDCSSMFNFLFAININIITIMNINIS